jgi:Cu+-exporting ATPase
MAAVADPRAETREQTTLALEGMTCASCAARIERTLNKVEGVEETVNFATETASVSFDPSVVAPGQLTAAIERIGYRAQLRDEHGGEHAAHEHDAKPLRLLAALVLSLPLLLMAMIPPLQFTGWEWVSLVLATPVVFWSGAQFHRAALLNARHRAATMDTLVSLGTLAAWTWSTVVLLAGLAEDTYFEAAAVITALILLGRYFEARAKRRSGAAIRALLELGAKEARLLRDGKEISVPVEQLTVGDLVVIRPGEKVATDGVVVEGSSAVDQSMLTGEPVPVEVGPGGEVAGATINTSGRLVVRATKVGADTALAQIARLVEQAQAGKASVQRLVDRISAIFVPIVILIALATLGGWLVSGASASTAFTAAVAVLIIACPCAMGLATPTALMVGTGRGAQLGILIKGPEVLEQTRHISTIVLDKTGTVTEGRMRLVDALPIEASRDELLRLAGAAESASEHPLAQAIAAATDEKPLVTEFRNHAGLGIEALVEGRAVLLGRPSFLTDWAIEFPKETHGWRMQAEGSGQTVVAVAWDGVLHGLLALADTLKPSSQQAVAELKQLGLTPVLLTGDNETAARSIAQEVGIDEVRAEVLPDGKAVEVQRLQQEGEMVAMVGDGVNDAPALATADLGLAIGTGTDVAIEASDLTLVSGDLRAAADAIRLARRTLATIKGNLFWAFAYNVAAIPLAVAGLLNPMIAAAAMAASSIFVVTNSLRLRRFRSAREGVAT